jgi:hypothetical protein
MAAQLQLPWLPVISQQESQSAASSGGKYHYRRSRGTGSSRRQLKLHETTLSRWPTKEVFQNRACPLSLQHTSSPVKRRLGFSLRSLCIIPLHLTF